MKSILLASASLVGFAGVAAAEVTFSGSATLGVNNYGEDEYDVPAGFEVEDDNEGFYWDANLAVALSQELDNGLTAGAEFNFDIADDNLGETAVEFDDYLLSLTSDMAALYFGDTAFAAETYWNGVGNTDADDFSEQDGETVLRGEVMYGSVTAGLSYVAADAAGDEVTDDPTIDSDADQLSVGATADLGQFSVGMAYQEESETTGGSYDPVGENGDFTADEIFGVFASTTFANADVSVAYSSNQTADETSTGVGVAYPFGPVTVGGSYAWNSDSADGYELTLGYANGPVTLDAFYENDIEDDDEGYENDEEYGIDGTYDAGNGLMFMAGMIGGEDHNNAFEDEDAIDYYVASTYDLGGGAQLMVSYGDDDDNSEEDEIGAPEIQTGTTVEVSFEF